MSTVLTIDVQRCIGCGAISTPQPCLGTCVDRRLDLVAADEHAAAVAAVEALERRIETQRTVLTDLAQITPAGWEPLRDRARAALHAPPAPPVPGIEITTWACDTCGRIEAPQPCIGVCVRPTVAMVPASEHRALLDRALELSGTLDRLAVPLRQLAWTTPRDPEASVRALRAAAVSAVEQMVEADLA